MAFNPEMTFTASNIMKADGQELHLAELPDYGGNRLKVSSVELDEVISANRLLISQTIEDVYQLTREKAGPEAEIHRPSILAAHIGTEGQTEGSGSKVLTRAGRDNGTGILTRDVELKKRFHPYWQVIHRNGYVPEVRLFTTKRYEDSWLTLRKPTLSEVALKWFNFRENVAQQTIRDQLEDSKSVMNQHAELTERAVRWYQYAGAKTIGLMTYHNGLNALDNQILGLKVSVAGLMQQTGDTQGFQDEVEDALRFAKRSDTIPPSSVRALENGLYGLK